MFTHEIQFQGERNDILFEFHLRKKRFFRLYLLRRRQQKMRDYFLINP
jgi:hypothetical protein